MASSTNDPLSSHLERQDNFCPSPPCGDFGVAIICALPVEAKAVCALFEEQWDDKGLDRAVTDTNSYSVGSIGSHPVVLAHMPTMGKVAAATVAGDLRASFRYLKLVLVVGICGGAPGTSKNPSKDVFLGDVVVSTGVVQYDLGRRFPGRFVRKDTPRDNLSRLSVVADGLLAKLKAVEAGRGREFSRAVSRHLDALQQQLDPKTPYPGRDEDRLFHPDYLHKHHELSECLVCAEITDAICDQAAKESCETLGCSQEMPNLAPRSPPEDRLQPTVHFGLVASGDTVMRSGRDRDEIARRDGVIAFEMEGAGCWEILRECSCLIIKSVCDYADSHKNKLFQDYAAAVAAATAKALLEGWDAYIPDSLQPLPSWQTFRKNRRSGFSVEEAKLLGRLKTVPYLDRKDRNPHRVPSTCEWFVSHRLFNDWLTGSRGKVCQALWVSADPGCGKSVLAKYLVDHVLPTTQSRTTCYFFFKDDFEDQKSVANAMCCILHQLFTQTPVLFDNTVRAQLEAEGANLAASFQSLWNILLQVAGHKNAGEIICILDALDECAANDRQVLAKALLDQHRTKRAPNLKFLVTSRPFGSIRRDFQPSDATELAVVHLSGENQEETKQISKEIDIFIKAKVCGVGAKLKLDKDEQDLLLHGLLSVPHRTYLWVYLTLDHIENSESINKRKIREALSRLPKSVDEAYEKILSTSCDLEELRKILHIIVAAVRPLTLREMNFALVIRPSHRSYRDLDLDPDERFRERLRNICGLFVVVIDSKIYLLHQTAREFLVMADSRRKPPKTPRPGNTKSGWKQSLESAESHRILGEICLWHLRFSELSEGIPVLLERDDSNLSYIQRLFSYADRLNRCVRDYEFLGYSAYCWAVHLRALHTRVDKEMLQAMLEICNACHLHRPWWFKAITREPTIWGLRLRSSITDDLAMTPLVIASCFGLVPAVQALVKTERGQLLARDTEGRTALAWAVVCGHADVARALIDGQPRMLRGLQRLGIWKPAIIEAADDEQMTPLLWAVKSESADIVRLLLDNGAKANARWCGGETALSLACSNGRLDVIQLLLRVGIDINEKDSRGLSALCYACRSGNEALVRLLVEQGADIEARCDDGRGPLYYCMYRDGSPEFDSIAKFLLNNGADLEARDSEGASVLSAVVKRGNWVGVKWLLENGADIESQNAHGETPLVLAAKDCRVGVIWALLQAGANVNVTARDGRSVLRLVIEHCRYGQVAIVEGLLHRGADIEYRDKQGRSALSHAVTMDDRVRMEEMVTVLLSVGANIHLKDNKGRTPLVWAAKTMWKDTGIVRLLIKHGADIMDIKDVDARTALLLACREAENPSTSELSGGIHGFLFPWQ